MILIVDGHYGFKNYGELYAEFRHICLFVCLGLTALSAQIGYIVPSDRTHKYKIPAPEVLKFQGLFIP